MRQAYFYPTFEQKHSVYLIWKRYRTSKPI